MKYLIFIRHAETVKNFNNEFSKDGKVDNLTDAGVIQATELSAFLKRTIESENLIIKNIYTSDSFRSIDTGKILSQHLSVPLCTVPFLTSYNMGEVAGLNENETKIKYPQFYEQLKLYRNGLLNSYLISYPLNAENPLDFEQRVSKGIYSIINNDNNEENIKIIILQRSTLTATYIHFARMFYNYPSNFYGFVPVDNGCFTLLEKRLDKWSFKCVNQNPTKFSL